MRGAVGAGGGRGLRSGSVKLRKVAGKSRCPNQAFGSLKEQHVCTGHQQAREGDQQKASAEKLRNFAKNCEFLQKKLRKIANFCEIAKNCEKLPPPPPPCCGSQRRAAVRHSRCTRPSGAQHFIRKVHGTGAIPTGNMGPQLPGPKMGTSHIPCPATEKSRQAEGPAEQDRWGMTALVP